MYKKLGGMTGTAMTEEEEFRKIYGLDVIAIPTNRPMVRKDHADVVYKTIKSKFNAVVEDIVERHEKGQPMLVGTVSVEKSEYLSSLLTRRGVKHQVLNAKYHEREAEIVAQAGRFGSVTIATNMAGRGTDILLGGNPEFMAKGRLRADGMEHEMIVAATEINPVQIPEVLEAHEKYHQYLKEAEAECKAEGDHVREVGGLCVIGTERHEARRIDNQLRGRSGRQGDPGESRFYVALEDDLMRLFGGEMVSNLMEKLGIEEDVPIDSPMVSRALENAQKKVEARNFDIRKHVIQYDDVMNTQRELIYKQRRRVLEGEDTRDISMLAIEQMAERLVHEAVGEEVYWEEWDPEMLVALCEEAGFPKGYVKPEVLKETVEQIRKVPEGKQKLAEAICEAGVKAYEDKEKRMGTEMFRHLERFVLLRTVDDKWMDHLDAMDDLREGVGLRAYGQKDPLIEYKLEAMEMFNHMIGTIQSETVRNLFTIEIAKEPEKPRRVIEIGSQGSTEPPAPVKNTEKKVGRNDPCPCGSGKKYKFCHGKGQ
jgi:preprotein translocase subunit SecA